MATDLISGPERLRLVKGGKVAIGKHVDQATAAVVQAYTKGWQVVRDDLLAAAADAERQAIAHGTPDVAAAYRTARLQQSLGALSRLLQQAGTVSGITVTGAVEPVVAIPGGVLQKMSGPGYAFDLVPDAALEGITRRATQKIASDYKVLSDVAEQQLRTTLVRAVAAGQGPRQAARDLVTATKAETLLRGGYAEGVVGLGREAFAGGLTRALNLCRTELLDASRYATTASYLHNPDLVTGWIWVCELGLRTCPSCLAMNGTFHGPDEFLDDHQQGRCTQVPVLSGERPEDVEVPRADDYLSGLSEEERNAQLGPARVEHLKQGGSLSDFTKRQDNAGWRSSRVSVPVKDLPTG